MKKNHSVLTVLFVLALSLVMLTGCVAPPQSAAIDIPNLQAAPLAAEPEAITGGVLCLKINPEIALHYDENGKVTKLEGRNADGQQILKDMADYTGKDTSQVLSELVELIGQAGYFVEEADGEARKIVLELDPGSQVPHEQFLEDMAAHVKACVENKSWIGEREYEYPEEVVTEPTVPVVQTTEHVTEPTTSTSVPAGLCPVCADDDCDEGIYCDDAHEKAENLLEYQRLMSGKVCEVCGDYDCDDGVYCDDADEKVENLREAEVKKEQLSSSGTSSSKTGTSSSGKSTSASSTSVPTGLCPVCADDDCDDGAYCDDADEKAENLQEYENRKNGTPCEVCGDYDCDDGAYCDDADEKAENEKENAAKKTSSSTKKTTTKKTTTKSKCSVCGESDCDDGAYCDDWDDRYDDDDDDDDDD